MFEVNELSVLLVVIFLAIVIVFGAFFLNRTADTFDPNTAWNGYADAKPSESIFDLELPGLAVAVVFPHKPDQFLLEPPVKQYKDCKGPRRKARSARDLAQWLSNQEKEGLVLVGFAHSHTQLSAAKLGMDLIEELPDTRVEPHYGSYRLYFGNEHLDFAQAIALEYYYLTINFGVLMAGKRLSSEHRKLFLAMDRFPGADTGDTDPGEPIPPTQGEKFIDYVITRSTTGIGIEKNNLSMDLVSRFGTINSWKRKHEKTFRKGKTHPHFLLPDWLAAAAIAHNHPVEFAATFKNKKDGAAALDALRDLFSTFKKFNIFSLDQNVLEHLRGESKVWAIPDEIRKTMLSRADIGKNGRST